MPYFKEITYRKTPFYQYAGSQNYVLTKYGNDKERKLIHIHNNSNGRMWGAVLRKDILKWIKKNIGLFEVISEYPCKLYFDIDGEDNEDVDICKVKEIIQNYFGKDVKMAISGYKTEKKSSYHICCYEYGIKSEEELIKMRGLVRYISENEYSAFDWKVYTKNRNMKAINQSKPRKEVQKIIEDKDERNHLITFYLESIKYDLPNIEVIKPDIETSIMRENTTNMDYSKLPSMILELPENIDINNPNEILRIIPNGKEFDHSWSWRVALFCVSNKLSCNDFLSWYKNKSTDVNNLNKWKYIHWPKVIENVKKYQVSCGAMLKTLQKFYPNILVNSELRSYANTFKIDDNNVRYTDYLTVNDMETDKKCILINIQMGGGKTHNTIEFLKKNDNFCWITPNIALSQNTHNRIETMGIKCHHYQDGLNLNHRKDNIAKAFNLMICLNSLQYVKQTYDVLVIDEIETFLKLWFNNKTLGNERLNECWKKFIELLRSSKKIILLDALLTRMTTNFLNDMGIDYMIIKKKKEENPRKVIRHKDFIPTINKIISDINEGKKLLIFYPYKSEVKNYPSMSGLVGTIEKYTGKKGIYHNADVSDKYNKKLENVNENWIEYDFVVSNNKINVGLNFDLEHFHEVYLFIAGFNSPRDLVQFSYRTRSLKNNILNYCFLDTYNRYTNILKENVEVENDIFGRLFNSVVIERRSPVVETFEFLLAKAHYKILGDFESVVCNEKLEFIHNDFYSYDKIPEVDYEKVEELTIKVCALNASLDEKIILKRYYYDNKFKDGTPVSVMTEIWDENKLNFMERCLDVFYKYDIVNKLKQNYGWELHFPEEIKRSFRFEKDDLEKVFGSVDFKYMNIDKSSHNLILKNFINTIYDANMMTIPKKEGKIYYVRDIYKTIYINVKEYHDPSQCLKLVGENYISKLS